MAKLKLPEPPAWVRSPWAGPALAGAVAAVTYVAMALFGPFHGTLKQLVAAGVAGGLGAFVNLVPKSLKSRKAGRIEDDLPLFITHFGVLATSNLPRVELVRMLASNEDYEDIASEMRRVLRLTQEWGLGLSEAVRAVAESTPSPIFSAFLLRLAHAVESGQTLDTFLLNEQGVVMHDYESIYKANLLKVDNWKEMYTSAIMTIGFLAVFAGILPLVAGGSTLTMTMGTALLTVFLEVMLGVLLRQRLPHDRLTPFRAVPTAAEKRLRLFLLAGFAGAAALGLLGFVLFGTGPAILIACLPLAVPGFLASRQEVAIRAREADYPAFIRSVGAAAAARGGAIRDTLGSVQANNLGALTVPVRDLHRRLMWRVDDKAAWRSFGQETGSRLIDSFTAMFVQGVSAGGKPGPISDIISSNMLKLLALRTTRRATAGAFRGLLIGLTVGLAAVLFLGFGIFSSITTTFASFGDVLSQQGLFTPQPASAMALSQTALLVLLGLHGFACGIFYKLVEGGRIEGATLHVVAQVWAGVAAALLVGSVLPGLLTFTGASGVAPVPHP